MSAQIDYGNLMHSAMRGLIRTVLRDVAERGLPGAHHFFITFDTTHDGVRMASWLRDRYPEEMTVVMQHWFEDLEVGEDEFSVTLNFGDAPENLCIPYDAIKTFVDPSVEFGLRFETAEDDEDETAEAIEDADPDQAPQPEDPRPDAEIVSLDSFRK
ncbi:SspB family protein [Pukyongiella litopenaei]|uniref:Stringent starvation protein B n=1 Tax=Pukyongiella litopenaei TaxID=2605946 RepID=A0A2S0MVK9_9RHOB|nr:ClpXP protease specificity-enhancing factor SspB [Pukyongiella litopenaei]AVO39751.1 hypothetical protein C6Y53_10995 [Pukyongiella litopenaei]